jgi:large repetitive protein
MVGADPQFLAPVVTNNQGHVWKITGTKFSTAPGATTVAFGAAAPITATCGSTTSCTVTSPAGSGTVDVVVTVGGQTSAITAADRFTYTVPAGPAVTGIAPNFGTANGGDTVTVTGTNFATDGSTTITFNTDAAATR